jgi:radical SAM protein with 4Fe4S-binding SPASM domain
MCHTYNLDPGSELSPEEIRMLCRKTPNLTWLDVTGGEPFLRKDAQEIFEAILENTPRLSVLHFPTNGWFTERVRATAGMIRTRRPELDLIITVSIDGPPDVHDQVRGQEGSFERAIKTFNKLNAMEEVSVYIGTTVSPHNQHGLKELEAALMAHIPGFHPRMWHKNWMQISGHFFDNEKDAASLPNSVAQIADHRKERGFPRSMVDLMEWMFLKNLEAHHRGESLDFDCQALHGSCFISADGDLYPCHVYDRPLGNLRDVDFDLSRLWAQPETRSARDDIKDLKCGGCFTACEAYPSIAGSPLRAMAETMKRSLPLL